MSVIVPPYSESFSGTSAFVTGGTGFVGSHLVEYLLNAGCTDVRCLVRKDQKWLTGLPVTYIEGTLDDMAVLEKGLKGVDYVFHVAALTRSVHWDDFLQANVQGTVNLLRAAKNELNSGDMERPATVEGQKLTHQSRLKRIVLVSSLAAIGTSGFDVVDENAPFAPVSMYGRSKAEMERVALDFDLPITIVRPPAVYGPRETDIFTFFKTVSMGLCPVVGSPSKPALSLVYVKDLVAGIAQSALSPAAINETFFLGSIEPLSWGQIRDAASKALNRRVLTLPISPKLIPTVGSVVELFGKLFGFYPPLNKEKAFEIVNATLMCDSSKAASTFGYAPSTPLNAGVKETIEWYKDQQWLK
ncbi:MAG: NAD-dependent epimerase/dehydratase family protein [Bacteroidetes bacterium]|nr:NAD-dependent epimerase/dehydratase family protein [Bacteroidota bacterium]